VNFTGGSYNRIDHCRMKDKKNSGVTVVTGIGEHHIRIDHNHFDGRPPGKYNGFETIRPGTGDMTSLYGIIEDNLFENCDGEGEIISVKSSVVLIRCNTFLNCVGMLSIRHANFVTVDHNFFINSAHKPGVGGVRIHGNDDNVLNNYFGDLTAVGLYTLWGDYDVPAFSYRSPGFFDIDYGAREYSYRRSCRANIAYNTWADCTDFLDLGVYQKRDVADMNLPPKDWSFLNNLVVSSAPQFIKGGGETGFRWVGNIFWNPKGTFKVGRDLPELSVKMVDPKLVREPDGLWRLSQGSPAIDSAEKTQWYWIHWVDNTDMDGQPRDLRDSEKRPFEFNTDVGADEYSSAPKKFLPLTPADVGPEAP
jgi:poly(beta-D-mannuronate) lyase